MIKLLLVGTIFATSVFSSGVLPKRQLITTSKTIVQNVCIGKSVGETSWFPENSLTNILGK